MSTHRTRIASASCALVALCLACVSAGALADESSKQAKLAELMRLQGIAEMFQQAKVVGQEQGQKMVKSMTDQMFGQLPVITPEVRSALEVAAQQFLKEVSASFDESDSEQAWMRLYGGKLTEQELDAILPYYRSEAGHKDVAASHAAMPEFQKYVAEKRSGAINGAVGRYTAALRKIVESQRAKSSDAAPQQQVAPTNKPTPATSPQPAPSGH